MARWTTTTVNTRLTVEQCSRVFKQVGDDALGRVGFAARFASKRMDSVRGFYTPRSGGDDPFSRFADAPDFKAGVAVSKLANNLNPRNIQIEVWDRQSHREVVLAANGPGQSLLPDFVAAFRAADSSATTR